MWDFFHNPYPFNDDFKRNLKIILGLSIGVFLFLILFDPFKIPVQDFNEKIQIILGYTLITIVALAIILIILPLLFQGVFLQGRWNVKKEILLNLALFFMHASGYLIFSVLTGFLGVNAYLIFRILAVSFVLIVILFVINQDRVLRIHLQSALDKIRSFGNVPPEVPENDNFTFPSEIKSDQTTLSIKSLIFIRSADNYIEVAWKDKQNIRKKLIRTTLKETELALKTFPFIIKCHRTCLVNVNNMVNLKESSGGLTVLQDGFNDEFPVSHQYLKEIKAFFRNKSN
jgi:hypothetical protein